MTDTTKIDDEEWKIIRNLIRMARDASLREDWEECAQYLNEVTAAIVKASSTAAMGKNHD